MTVTYQIINNLELCFVNVSLWYSIAVL